MWKSLVHPTDGHRESQMMRPAGRRGRWVWEAPDGGQIGGVAVGWNNNEPD